PFSLEELSARVRAQLRLKQQTPNHILHWQDLSMYTQAKNLTKAGQATNLTAKEFQILYKLMQQPEHIVTCEQLEESLYEWGDDIERNMIEVFIYQLSKKNRSQIIKTISGLGYSTNKADA